MVTPRGEIAFWHLTFQEFLAALEISWLEDADQHELLLGGPEPRIYRPEWRETALLYAGLFAEGPRKLDALLRKLLDRMGPALPDRAKCVGLIGALKRDLIGYEVSDPRYQESLSAVMDIFDKKKSQSVPFQDRLAAAEALGQAGDSRVEEIEWVKIPASSNYRIGATKKEDPEAWEDREKPRMVPEIAPFTISKYPVTVSQYAKFVDAEPSQQPARWDEQLEHPNWPVVNVTWHQANAFCEWAKCRLPTEEEWERAARGPDRTKYPWGSNDIDPSRANYDESKIGHPTPVGLYPTGASVEGVLDLIGNVWEWTDSWYDKDQDTRVVRGGAFYNLRDYARASYRDYSLPDDLYDGLGFRVAGGIT
ncbi:MAG: formylglycine-generating enzyme family protein [Bryobacteraceae bacterium]